MKANYPYYGLFAIAAVIISTAILIEASVQAHQYELQQTVRAMTKRECLK